MTYVEVALGFYAFGCLCGYYLGHRGMAGVKSDLTDVKTELANLKAKISG